MEAGKIKLVERILTYPITKEYDGLSIKEFLKKQNYSDQLIIALKKMEQSILVTMLGVMSTISCVIMIN